MDNGANDVLRFLIAKDYIPKNNVPQKANYYIFLILFATKWIEIYIY